MTPSATVLGCPKLGKPYSREETRLQRCWSAGLALLTAALLGACGDDGASTREAAGADRQARTVVHAMGTTTISGTPSRVVVLDTGEFDSALALGVTPVGAVEAVAGSGFPAYIAERASGVKKVGTVEQPSVEAIAALRPDLILSSKLRHEKIYDQLARIAPTVFSEEVGVTWKENFKLHAEALGRSDEARRMERAYADKVADLRTAMRAADRRRTAVSVVRSVGDEVRIYANDSFIGTILRDAGIVRPEPQDVDEFSLTATRERIADLDGDVMVLAKYGAEHRLLEKLAESRLWKRLDVVREDRIYFVPDDRWFLGIGNLAARLVVDDLRTILVDGKRLPGDDPGKPLA